MINITEIVSTTIISCLLCHFQEVAHPDAILILITGDALYHTNIPSETDVCFPLLADGNVLVKMACTLLAQGGRGQHDRVQRWAESVYESEEDKTKGGHRVRRPKRYTSFIQGVSRPLCF
jgi:hypothetical protein